MTTRDTCRTSIPRAEISKGKWEREEGEEERDEEEEEKVGLTQDVGGDEDLELALSEVLEDVIALFRRHLLAVQHFYFMSRLSHLLRELLCRSYRL